MRLSGCLIPLLRWSQKFRYINALEFQERQVKDADGTYAGADTSALQEAKSRKIAMGDVNKQLMGEEDELERKLEAAEARIESMKARE